MISHGPVYQILDLHHAQNRSTALNQVILPETRFENTVNQGHFSSHPKNVISISCAGGVNVHDNDTDREKIADMYNHDRYGRRW